MSIEEIIKVLKEHESWLKMVGPETKKEVEAVSTAIALLKTHPEAQPNEPLTIEDLLNMSGRPVWIEDSALGKEWAIVGCPSHMKKNVRLSYSDGNSLWVDQIFGSGKIYRRPPKEDC